MRIFATRHGQVMPQRFFNEDMNFPAGDEPITDLGRRQARMLGEHLKSIGFKGVIYASPYDRTMETASIISEALGIGFTPMPCLREMFVTYNASRDFVGLRPEKIKERFPRAELTVDMPYPWWEIKDDTLDDLIERLRHGLKLSLSTLPRQTDVLLVGHAATVVALREVFHPGNYKSSLHWNCCLNLLYSDTGETFTHDAEFIPEDIRTANYLWYKDEKEKLNTQLCDAKRFFEEGSGTRVLHIGDTHSALYHYYIKLIEELSPDVIVHTGDFADELKAGRVEGAKKYWKERVPTLTEAMNLSGSRLIVVRGNNDIPEELSRLMPSAEICEPNTVKIIGEKRVCFTHEVWRIDPDVDADIYLYGHGRSDETRTPTDNVRGTRKYFNAVWGVSLHLPEEDKHLILSEIEL